MSMISCSDSITTVAEERANASVFIFEADGSGILQRRDRHIPTNEDAFRVMAVDEKSALVGSRGTTSGRARLAISG
jgi:hypothetical protein